MGYVLTPVCFKKEVALSSLEAVLAKPLGPAQCQADSTGLLTNLSALAYPSQIGLAIPIAIHGTEGHRGPAGAFDAPDLRGVAELRGGRSAVLWTRTSSVVPSLALLERSPSGSS